MAQTTGVALAPLSVERPLDGRLGLNVPAGWWPTAASLKSFEAAGYGWVQVHSPPRATLTGSEAARHAAALRAALDVGALRLVLHAPDDLLAADARPLAALLDYASRVRAELIVLHAANLPAGAPTREEERGLRRAGRLAEGLGVTLAVENLAPVFGGEQRVSYDPRVMVDLVERVGSDAVRMCFDVGHAHIVGALETIDEAAPAVALFHLHDNFGSREHGSAPATVDPLRLDLHLPPGTGTVPWETVAPVLLGHDAPLQLEVHPPHRPEAPGLATVTAQLLGGAGEEWVNGCCGA